MNAAPGDGKRGSRRRPRTPSRSRRLPGRASRDDAPQALERSLSYRPPLDWSALLAFLARRAVAGVEHVQDDVYLRSLRFEQDGAAHSGWMAVRPAQDDGILRIALSTSLSPVASAVLAAATRAFDLTCDPRRVAA